MGEHVDIQTQELFGQQALTLARPTKCVFCKFQIISVVRLDCLFV